MFNICYKKLNSKTDILLENFGCVVFSIAFFGRYDKVVPNGVYSMDFVHH